MPNDAIIRYLSLDGNHQLYLVDATAVMEEVCKVKPLSEGSFQVLSNIICLALLRSNNLKGASQTLSFQLDTLSDIEKVIATANAKGEVKGYVKNPQASGKIGSAMISCTADLGAKQPYHSTCIVEGVDLEDKINSFFTQSDQTVLRFSSLIEGERVVALLYHELPHEDGVPSLFDKEKAHESLRKNDFLEMANNFFASLPFEEVSRENVKFRCNCSKERFLELFKLLSEEELLDLIHKGENAVSTCGWCGKEYEFTPEELSALLPKGK